MLKKIIKIGNSHGILIDRAILQLMNVNENTQLKLELNGSKLTIEPVEVSDFEAAGRKVAANHSKALAKLAE